MSIVYNGKLSSGKALQVGIDRGIVVGVTPYETGYTARYKDDLTYGRPVPPDAPIGSSESLRWAKDSKEWWQGWWAASDEIAV